MERREIIYFMVVFLFVCFLFYSESHRLNSIQRNFGSPTATLSFSSIYCGKKMILFFLWPPWLTNLCALCIMGHTRISCFSKKMERIGDTWKRQTKLTDSEAWAQVNITSLLCHHRQDTYALQTCENTIPTSSGCCQYKHTTKFRIWVEPKNI